MERCGVTCSAPEFQAAVNVTFHRFESAVYDILHRDMWESLPRQFDLLINDWLSDGGPQVEKLQVLDIGSGTGLASDSLLKTAVGPRIASIDLLDTSAQMLARAVERAKSWPVRTTAIEGLIEAIPREPRYDLIVTSSVLHHVPDLASFVKSVRILQKPGGAFIHLQDPNGDYLRDAELMRRIEQGQTESSKWMHKLTPTKIARRLKRTVTGHPDEDDIENYYIWQTNHALIENGTIQKPLTVQELFTITDIHVQDGHGISIRALQPLMAGYRLVSVRSYGFFGRLASDLPPELRAREDELIAAQARNGQHIAAVWVANPVQT